MRKSPPHPVSPAGMQTRLILPALAAAILFLVSPLQGPVLAAQGKEKTDQEQIDEMREQIDEMWDVIDEMEDRLVEEEKKTAWDRLNLYGDFRVRYAYEKWNLPQQYNFPTFLQMMQFGTPAQAAGTIVSIVDFLANNKLPLVRRDPFSLTNSENWDMRFRLKMKADISKNIGFHAWLTVKRNFGSGIIDPIFNGYPNTVYNSFNASSIPSDVTVKLQRAYGTWAPDFAPLVLTVGRQAAQDGPPREIKEDRVRQGTPPALLIDAEIDGIMLGVKVHELVKSLPPTTARICYGIGYEAGFGGGGRVEESTVNTGMFRWVAVEGMRDMKVLGGCADTQLPFLSDKTLFSLAYFRGMDLTDIPSALTVNFPDPWGSTAQRVTGTANLGDIDLFGFVLESNNFGVEWFLSAGCNIFYPNGKLSQYGFGGLGVNDPRYATQLGTVPVALNTSHAGYSVYTGFKVPVPVLYSKFGFEYNYGSKYWFSFTQASDDINNKLATRGHVLEPYWILNIYQDNLLARMGYQYYLYDYGLSGWHLGDPAPVQDGGTYFYPTPREIHNLYALLEFRF